MWLDCHKRVCARAQPGGGGEAGAKGLKSPPLARLKLKKNVRSLIFSRLCASNPIKILLQHYHILPVI